MSGQLPQALEGLTDDACASELCKSIDDGGERYFLVHQMADAESSLSLFRMIGGVPKLMRTDESLGALLTEDRDEADILERIRAIGRSLDEPPPEVDAPDAAEAEPEEPRLAPAGAADLAAFNERIVAAAEQGVGDPGMNSAIHAPPETKGGTLACAWAVNRIVKRALGAPVGGGLSTIDMAAVLRKKDRLCEAPFPGAIVISPTGTKVGHVGIVGAGGTIYSNSSNRGRWEQNYTVTSWYQRFRDTKGLPVHFFQLNPARFPPVGG